MIFAKLDVDITDHPKAIAAGPGPFGIWAWALAYCRKHELDGIVPIRALRQALGGRPENDVHAATLVAVGLFSVRGDGDFEFENYAKKNETKASIVKRRTETSNRVAKFRDVTQLKRVTPSDLIRVTNTNVTDPCNAFVPGSDSDSDSDSVLRSDPDLPPHVEIPPEEAPSGVHMSPPRDPVVASYAAFAYAAGQVEAGAETFPTPTDLKDIRALDTMIATYAKAIDGGPARGSGAIEWVRTTSAAYRKAKALSARFERGYAPSKCLEWIQAGRPIDQAKDRFGKPVESGPPEKRAKTMSERMTRAEEEAYMRDFERAGTK